MSSSIRQFSAFMLGCLLLAAIQCSTLSPGGTGSETVIGKIVLEDGTPAGKTEVSLRPDTFDPTSDLSSYSYIDTTDSLGRYSFTITAPTINRYTLQAVSLSLRTRTIVPGIDVSAPSKSTVVATTSLHKTGSIKAILFDSSGAANGYVYIPGTTLHAYLENGYATIDSVPAEMISDVNYNENVEMSVSRILAESIEVKPGIATIITFAGAVHATNFFMNTTSGGANVAGNVYGFPLLIRLSNSNFVFNEARADGSDLRFTKSDNSPVPFEIERWDATSQHAEIWVRIDTVYGNDSSHFVTMYWGESAAAMPLYQALVFDTANGFSGVWHMGEEAAGVGTKGLYKDATGRNNGDDYISATDRSGIIGYGHAFNGIDDYILINSPVTNFVKGDLTISVWVNIHDSGGTILSKLDTSLKWKKGESSFYFGDGTNVHTPPGGNGSIPSFVEYTNSYAIAQQPVASDGWHYLVFTWKWNGDSTGTSRYYIDGVEIPLNEDSITVRVDENSNAMVRIGQPDKNESYAFFKGLMDELEIANVVRSADWVKLCYINQRMDNVFVK